LAYQLDLPYIAIRLLSAVGAVTSVRDSRAEFMRAYYEPYLRSLQGTALGDVPHNAE
jgi:hypothetical protein